MSGSFPTTPEFKAINITSRHSNLVSETRSGRRQARSIGTQRWAFTAQYNPLTRAEFMPVYAFVINQDGQNSTFTIEPPVISDAQGNVAGTMQANGVHAIGSQSISVDGITGTIKAGDFVKFGHSKVYMVTADATASAGAATLNIMPGLVTAVANDETVNYDNITFTMRLNNDIQEYSLNANEYYTFELDMIEVV